MNFEEINLQQSGVFFQNSNQNQYLEYDNEEKLQQLQNKFNFYIQDYRSYRENQTLSHRNKNDKNHPNNNQIQDRYQKNSQKFNQKSVHQNVQKSSQRQQSQHSKKKSGDFKLFNRNKSKSTQINKNQSNTNNYQNQKQSQKQKFEKVQTEDQKLSGSLFINNHDKSLSRSRQKSHSLFQMANELTEMQNLMKKHLKQKQLIIQQLLREIQIQKMEKVHLFQINQKLQEQLATLENQNINQSKFKFITNDQDINKKFAEIQKQFDIIKATYQKLKKQNSQLKREENTLKQTLKIAMDNRKKWMIIEKQKCQQNLKSNSINKTKNYKIDNNAIKKQQLKPFQKTNNNAVQQEQLLRKLLDQFSKLKELVEKKTKSKKIKL